MRLYCVCMECGSWTPVNAGDRAGCPGCEARARPKTWAFIPEPMDIEALVAKYPGLEASLRHVHSNVDRISSQGRDQATREALVDGAGIWSLELGCDFGLAIKTMVEEKMLCPYFRLRRDTGAWSPIAWASEDEIPENVKRGCRVFRCYRWSYKAPPKPGEGLFRLARFFGTVLGGVK